MIRDSRWLNLRPEWKLSIKHVEYKQHELNKKGEKMEKPEENM